MSDIKMKFEDIIKCYIYNKFHYLEFIKDLDYTITPELPDNIKNDKNLIMYYNMLLLEGKIFLKNTTFKVSTLINAIEDFIKEAIVYSLSKNINLNKLDYDTFIDIYNRAILLASTLEEIYRILKHLDPESICSKCYYKDNCSVKEYLFTPVHNSNEPIKG